MKHRPSVLAVIPARGGSKGLPGKNIKPLCDKPLISWTVELAISCDLITRVVVTTDDIDIANIAERAGADIPFMRPPYLATDESSSRDVLLHCVANVGGVYDIVLLLQPTTPLRTMTTLRKAIELCIKSGKPVVSVTESAKPLEWMFRIRDGRLGYACEVPEIRPSRRQDCDPAFYIDGNVYCWPTDWLLEQPALIDESAIPVVSSKNEAVDIDTIDDFNYCEYLLKRDSGYEN